jgi:4-hydroxybenzoate polyprenyltransferase
VRFNAATFSIDIVEIITASSVYFKAARQREEMNQLTTKIRAVALPAEHGGWALVIEPIVLGLIVAPSIGGLFISLAALACFLARHPLKTAIVDRRKKRVLNRTSLAERFALLYTTLAITFFAVAALTLNREWLLPLLVAAPLVLVQLFYDARGFSRKLVPEMAGALAVGSISTSIALAGGWARPTAYALWIIVACRHAPTILYLRVLLSRRRQPEATTGAAVIVAQLLALIAVVLLLVFRVAPLLTIVVFVVLFVRALIGLFNQRAPTPKKLGLSEIAFGAFTILTVGAAYRFGW